MLELVLSLLSIPVVVATAYLALLTALSRRPGPPPRPLATVRFDVVVPAHDEEAGIERTVRNLLGLDWPRDLFRVVVVADNCRDRTAEIAEAAGATVLVRNEPGRRGKGYALELAIERSIADGSADAVVVVDADTLASANLLAAFAARLETGVEAMQARYAVLNPHASWRTRLMTLAFALVNELRMLGRERLGASCGLVGNGMCFSIRALRLVPYRAFSLVEDLEYGIALAEAGIRVRFAPEAVVLSEMVAGEEASRSQRQRWEGGRLAIARAKALPLLLRGIESRSFVLLNLAFDLLLPPLSWLAAYAGVGAIAAAALVILGGASGLLLLPWLVAIVFLGVYVTRGLWLSGLGSSGVLALAWAPAFVVWKLLLPLRGGRRGASTWVRTARDPKAPEERVEREAE